MSSSVFKKTGIAILTFILAPVFTFAADIEYITVEKKPVMQNRQFDGVVEAVHQGTVAAQTSGRVITVHVDVNDKVNKGDVLLDISKTEQTAALDAANANLSSAIARNDDAQSQLERYKQLYPKGAISRQQMDSSIANAKSARAAVKAAQASVESAKQSLGYTSIRAPYDGIVTERLVEMGETVSVGMPLLSGYGTHPLRLTFDIPQQYRDSIKDIAQFTVETSTGEKIQPESFQVYPYANKQTHSFTIRLLLPDDATDQYKLVPGLWLKANINTGESLLMMVPKSSVMTRGELSSVYRLSGNKEILNPIRVGQQVGDQVEVLSGLELGDHIVKNAYRLER
ncbi:efflux RND transporter periplasmic adaptor subunit [Vibrio viridaestus]|uniref:Efflux RND transporter periplasmic adaptor subunit n=1 Tax=Vibrio viridaestus TaxID=2487322 RepID=A0A3N9TEK7_9VIBR|nr:efflux RND transporter periplasmic adaptor subunit [Vibrio viridaestus]RQW62549.1 efflux RND transporter periplasmic adaptor subunit [Vibrio viridaestus]